MTCITTEILIFAFKSYYKTGEVSEIQSESKVQLKYSLK